MNIKKEKANNTAHHFIYNEPALDTKEKTDVVILVDVSAEDFYKNNDSEICVIEPACSVYDVTDYYSANKNFNFTVVASNDKLSKVVLEQKYTSKLNVKCFETGESFSFKDSLHLHARLYVITGENYYRNVTAMLCQSLINIKNSKNSLRKKLEGYKLTQEQVQLVMSRKNWKLENAVKGNLFLPKMVNKSNITSIKSVPRDISLAIKAATGAGKNVELLNVLMKSAIENGEKISFISSNKSIINMNIQTHLDAGEGFTSYEAGAQVIDAINPLAFTVCINSLSRKVFLEQVLSSKLVIIDEIEACIRNILLGNDDPNSKMRMTKKERQLIIESLTKVIKTAPQLVVADADISPLTADFLTSIRPDIQIFDMEQNYSRITASVGTKEMVLVEATEAIKANNENVVVMFDKIKDLNVFLKGIDLNDETALKEGILVLSSDTSDREEQAAFLANPNAVLATGDYRAILCSPTLGRGFSITHNYTNKIYAIANGVLDPNSMIQFPRRFRTATEFVYGVNTDYKKTVDHTANLVATNNAKDDAFNALIAAYRTEHELLVSNIAITLPEALRLLKFNMVEHSSLDASEDERKAATETMQKNKRMTKKEEMNLTLSANDKTLEEAIELEKKAGKSRTEKFEIERHIVQQKTGVQDITKTEIEFCNKFKMDMHKILTESSRNKCTDAQNLIYDAFSQASSGRTLATSEIVINQAVAVSIVKQLQANSNKVDGALPDYLRLGKGTITPASALKTVRALLEAAGYRSRSSRVKRVINGVSVHCYIYSLHEYATKTANYLK